MNVNPYESPGDPGQQRPELPVVDSGQLLTRAKYLLTVAAVAQLPFFLCVFAFVDSRNMHRATVVIAVAGIVVAVPLITMAGWMILRMRGSSVPAAPKPEE